MFLPERIVFSDFMLTWKNTFSSIKMFFVGKCRVSSIGRSENLTAQIV